MQCKVVVAYILLHYIYIEQQRAANKYFILYVLIVVN